MCVACIEYTRDKLNLKEFGAAMREMSLEDRAHAEEVAKLIEAYGSQPDELKKRLKALQRS